VRFLGAFSRRRDLAQTGTPRTAVPDVAATLLDGRTKLASELVSGDVLIIDAGCPIPCDGTVTDGIAMVDESAITGESAPVLHDPASGRSAVIAGTRVVSGRIVINI
jgi:potassium-transporting ATPase ATP-binding subunit